MKKIKLLLVFVFSTLLFLPAQAERVDAEKAEKVARSYARRTPRLSTQQNFRHIRTVSKRVQRKSVALRSASQQDDPMYHVFASDGGGFIIIAGDDVALPVLGYAGEGTYDESNPNLAYWMETLAQEIAWAIENGVRQDPGTQAAWEDFDNENSVSTRASGDYVDPLVKTKWDQGAPYNSQCPQISGTSTYTGCVATAMAQIMYYHTCPATTGTGSHSYTHSGAGQLSADFAATTYQWNSMTTTYSSSSGSAAKSAVATLMYHCGVSVNMNYGTKSSSASSGAVPNALATYFGYDAGASYLSRNIYSYTEWVNMLKNELRNDRPVYYSGSSSTGSGHAFVCDGYDTDDLFHINWGWAGSSDGYFEISALSPNAIGIGGGAGGYNTVQGMIIGVKPYAGGSSPDIQMGIADFYASKASLSSLTESFKITLIKVSNAGSVAISNTSLGIWLCKSDDTHVSYGVIYNDIPLNPGYYYSSITADFYTLPNNLQPGTYKLYPAYKQSGQSTPTVIPGENGDKYITVTVNSYNSVTLSSGSAVAPSLTLKSLSAEGNLYHNKPGSMKAEIENTGTGDYNAKLQIRLNNVAWATDPVVIPAGATKTIGFSDTVKLDAGSYTASLWYDPANVQSNNPSAQLGNDLTVEVKSTPAGSPSLSVESLSFSPDEDQVSINDLNLTVKIKNAGELYSSYVYIFIFPYSGGSSITSFRKSNVTIDKNETKTLVFNNPLDMLTAGTKYIVGVYAEVNGSRTMIGNLVPFTVKAHAPSFDATLKRITVKDAQTSTVLETFNVSSGTTAYNVDNVAATVTAISIIGEANESRAKFSNIENASFTGATKSYNITVTADDKTTTKTYTITLNRVAAAKYGVNIGTATGGSVTTPGNQNSYEAGTTVTLNVSPGTGYELDNISVHENDGSNTPVNLSGSGNTRTFTMPACAVTVTATFKKTDATLLSEAKTLIEASPYTVGEATANTEDGVKTWLAGQINALPSISQTGIDAVTKDNISTSSSFTAAHMGTDGSFSFTVTLKKNGSTAAAAVTGTITATPAFTVTINSGTNGAIQITPTIYHALETVTYTVFPATGYELNNISACKTGDESMPVSINTSSRSFTMPAHDVTVTATFKENVDQVAVIAARKAIEGATYTVAQATANDVNQVKAWLSAQFSALPAVNGITVNITKAAVAGTVGNLNGTDGQFTFTVDLQKGASATVTTASTTGTITATQAHTIAVGSNITNGGITALAAATEGTAVTLTATPAADYELKTLSCYKTGDPETTVTITGNQFTMPNYDVTVTATFDMTADRKDVEAARTAIENATSSYTVTQATANDESNIRAWLLNHINTSVIPSSTGITISVTTKSFTSASAGTDAIQAKDGSFVFTVTLLKNGATVTTSQKTVTITGTPYVAPSYYTIDISITEGSGSVSPNPPGPVTGNTSVTLTITPDQGYELKDNIEIYKTGNTTVSFTGSGNTRTFTMPGDNVTVKAAFKKTAGQIAVESAKANVEAYIYNVMQATANDDTNVKTWLSGQLTTLLGTTGITATVALDGAVTPAAKGTAASHSGTDGSFKFTVLLEKGSDGEITTASITGVITATHVYSITSGSIVSLSGGVNIAAAGETVTFTVSPATGYEIATLSVEKSGETSITPTSVGGSGYQFTMPAYDVTITATTQKTADQLTAEAAASQIAAASYTVPQATANTDEEVKKWLVNQINDLIKDKDITVLENDITITGTFTAAEDGKTVNQPDGKPGSFDFTVTLQKGASASVTTGSTTGTITATKAYYVTVNSGIVNGSVSSSPSLALQNESVTLTVTPDITPVEYELDYVDAYQTGSNPKIKVPLTVSSGNTRTFTMPAYNVTVDAAFRKTADQTDLESAKNKIETSPCTVNQSVANTAADVWTWLEPKLNALLTGTGVTMSGSSNASITSFTAAEAGTSGNNAGTNGSYDFSITLSKNGKTLSAGKSGNEITATPYTAPNTYIITIDATNGTVTANQSASIEGGTGIILTLHSNPGYELNTFNIYKSDNTNTAVPFSMTESTCNFTMPGYHVTVKAVFTITSDRQAVEDAKAILDDRTFSVEQALALTSPAVKSWLLTEINNRINSTGVTVSANDIDVTAFTAATAGTAGTPSGTNGSFNFSVTLKKGSSSTLNATYAGNIVATGYSAQSTYTVTITPPAYGGTVTASPSNPVGTGATVTLTLAPDPGYIPATVTVCKTGDSRITFGLSVTGANTRTFSMPGCDVTVTVAFTATPDRQAVESAQSLITSATFTVLQSDANTQDDVRNWLAMQINSLVGSTGVNTVTSPDITIGSFTAATAGTPSGTNGSFTFTVALAKGSSSLITPSKSGTITATALNAPTYTVTVVPSTNGSATVSPSGAVAEGATMTLTLAPSTDYEPASLRIYRTGVPSTPVPFTGSGNTRIFQMPGYNVTVEATFQPTSQFSDQQDVDNARSLIESATFNILQVTANSPDDVRSWLTQEINSLIGSTGVMALASGITVSNFMAAIAGTADLPSGTNGSFTFTVALGKNSATATTSARTGRIIATAYTPPAQYGITVRASSNGSVTANAASAPEGATVTLTLAPEEGYEPDHVSVYRSASATPLALAGTGLTRTFTMPGYGVTVEATFRKTQEQIDEETVEEAKDMIEGGTYRIAQATGNTATTVSAWVANVLNLLLSGQNAVITLRSAEPEALAADVTLTELVPAVEGTEVNPAGVNGSFRFIVVLTKGNVHIQTLEIDGVIVAMPYAATPVKRIELLPIGEMRVRIINTGNTATGNLTVTLSGANAQAFTLSSAAPGSLATGGETDILLIPADGLPTGVYTATMTVSGEGITPVSVDITYRVSPTGNAAFAASCVWAAGNTLYIAAATAGEARIFSIGGQLVKIVSHTAGETVKTLLQQGLYIVVAEGETYKITVR